VSVTLYCGDPHGSFRHILDAAARMPQAMVVVLGDLELRRPLHDELAAIASRLHFVHGNHDADTDSTWGFIWDSALAGRNVHGRVEVLPDGSRLAGLGGVFRGAVWYPRGPGEPAFRNRDDHAKATPRQDRWRSGPHRKHWGTIYPDELDHLATLRADVLITHEAPGYHHQGFEILDTLAQCLGVQLLVHGHSHDRLDSSGRWVAQGFRSFGVGLRGITAIDSDGHAEVVVPGELDGPRMHRQQFVGNEGESA